MPASTRNHQAKIRIHFNKLRLVFGYYLIIRVHAITLFNIHRNNVRSDPCQFEEIQLSTQIEVDQYIAFVSGQISLKSELQQKDIGAGFIISYAMFIIKPALSHIA